MENQEEYNKLIELFKKEETQEALIASAIQIQGRFKFGWFTFSDIVSAMIVEHDTFEDKKEKAQQAETMLHLLLISGFLLDKKRGDNVFKYRISGNKFEKLTNVIRENIQSEEK